MMKKSGAAKMAAKPGASMMPSGMPMMKKGGKATYRKGGKAMKAC